MSQLQVTGEAKIRDIQGPVIANSGVITALDGAASQYVRGDGTLADFPTSTGGGSSVSYYLNGSINQGTFAGSTYYEMSKTPIIGAGTDFPVSTNGLVAQFITDANDPDLLEVPGGNFNLEFYFSVNNNTGNPTVYAELYKYDGTTFTLLGSSQAIPESINQGTTIAPYYFAIPVGTAALALTDRIAIRIYANVDGRTVTLHTENSHLCQVVTTFSKGMVSLNNLTDQSQFITTGTSGTNFNIVSSGDTHTFNLPVASATNTGKLSNTDWSTFNNKQAALSFTAPLDNTANTISIPAATSLVDGYLDNLDWVNFNTAYNNMIVSAAVTGTTTKTLTLTQQDAGTITASWTDDNTDAVTSVFGRTGAVVAASGDYTTTQVTEGTNLYFTDARARGALSFTAGSGAYNSTTGVITIPTNTNQLTNGASFITLTSLSAGTGISYNNTTGVITSTITQYTDALARAAISLTTTGTSGAATYNSTTGVFNIPQYQGVLTNPVTGTGNNNYIAKFSSTGSTIANSLLQSNASSVFIFQEDTYLGVDAQALTRLGFVKKSGFAPTIGYASSAFTISSTVGTSIDASNTFVTRFTLALDGAATFTNSITATQGNFNQTATSGFAIRLTNRNANQTWAQVVDVDSVDDKYFGLYDVTNSVYRMIVTNTGNIGFGVSPSAWASPFKPIQIGTYGQYLAGQTNGPDIKIGANHYYSGTNYIYTLSSHGAAQFNVAGNSGFQFNVAGVGTAGAAVTFNTAMSVNPNGNVLIGSTTDNGSKLQVTGSSTISGNVLIGTTTALQSNEKVGIETDTNTALITKFTGGAATGWAAKFWNNATTGDNFLIEFLTEASITARGSIKYDRAGNRLNIIGAGSGLLFTGAATFSSSIAATSAFFNASNGFGLAGRNAANTQYRNLIILNSGNQIEIGRDTDISQIRLGTASANDALTITSGGNVYVNTTTGVSGGGALQVNGNVNINGVFQINGTTIGGGGGSGVTGSGTTNFVTKWTGGTTIGNSIIQDTGTNVGIGAAPLSFTKLYVADIGANIVGGNAIAGSTMKGVMIENTNNNDESIGVWFRTGNNHLSGISGQRFNSSTGWGTDLRFYTHEAATTDLTYTRERMRITTEGSILINRLTDAGYKFDVNGTGRFTGDLTTANIVAAGSVTASSGFFDTSDSRLKIVIKDYNQAKGIEKVEARLYLKNNKKELGYFAQDVQEILPSAVIEGEDGFLTLSYSQVHTAKIAYLENKISQLEELIKSLL